MKKIVFCLIVLCSIVSSAQEKENPFTVFGGLESNATWYMNDPGLNVVHPEPAVRSNNYLFVNGKYKGWTAGIQVESYEDEALLNYNPKYIDTDVATYYMQYKNEMVEITAGYFYEQFGSGLLLRTWEDRQLGINNSLRGGRIVFTPWSWLAIKGLYGRQRTGFDVAESDIYGTDIEFGLSDIFKFKTTQLSVGGSYVGRDQKVYDVPHPDYRDRTDAYAARLNFSHSNFYASAEYDYKSDDAVVEKQDQVKNNFIRPGQALLLNMGYTKKGFGVDGTFRRLENMGFYSEREAAKNPYNDRILNYLPGLTKQQHYNLANIYVYQAQPGVAMPDYTVLKPGEIGGQIDVFYNFKKGSTLGGKNGTKLALNYSEWHALSGDFYLPKKDYDVDYFGFGKKYFSEFNIEIDKRWSDRWHSIFTYIKQYNNLKLVQETYGEVNADIIAAEATFKFGKSSSIRGIAEHLWADADKKNWAAGTAEFNLNPKWSFYANDMWNYGNDDPEARDHYFNVGSAFRYKSIRAALNYGRQRGGLVCVGGVCRFVPESSGLSLSVNAAF